jgi:S-methylmethionine-dependent homocysteine/selenocysteine methylase
VSAAEITLLDGGMSREIVAQGGTLRQPEWSALALWEAPETVARAHAAFIDAGADVITTNSYALVPFHIGEERFGSEAEALASRAGRLARDAADAAGHHVRVAGCLPPPLGSYRPDRFEPVTAAEILGPLVRGLSPHVDLWLAETLSSLDEARGAAAAVRGDGRPLWLAFTLEDGEEVAPPSAPRLRSGELASEAIALARSLGAEAALFNCSGAEVVAPALQAALPLAGSMPIGAYANAFAPAPSRPAANETLSPLRPDLTPKTYAAVVSDWVGIGATIVGGGCGIGSAHIATLAERLGGSTPPRPLTESSRPRTP